MSRPDPVRVHVLTRDDRIREAVRALPPGYEITYSADKWEALAAVERGADVAVLDLDLTGFGIAKDIGDRVTDPAVKVVMICSRPHDRWLSLQAGADEVVVKPLADTSQLTRAIESVSASV